MSLQVIQIYTSDTSQLDDYMAISFSHWLYAWKWYEDDPKSLLDAFKDIYCSIHEWKQLYKIDLGFYFIQLEMFTWDKIGTTVKRGVFMGRVGWAGEYPGLAWL